MQIRESLIYIGPNRRSNSTVIEWVLQLTPAEQEAFQLAKAHGLPVVHAMLNSLGCRVPAAQEKGGRETVATEERCVVCEVARLVVGIALAMQQAAGHRVVFSTVLPGTAAGQCRLVYEYELSDCGLDAGELALRLLSESIPGLEWEHRTERAGLELPDEYRAFTVRAAEQLLPLDAQAIIDAAARLDVPCVKLERAPYEGLKGDFRVRRNGLLKLGHSCFQLIVDGTLCIDRSSGLVPLLFDREKMFACLLGLGLPAPRQDMEFRNLLTAKRAIRAAERIGYPVVLKPVTRSRANGFACTKTRAALESATEVRAAFDQARTTSQRVTVEQHVAGSACQLLLANHELVGVLGPGGEEILPSTLHFSILEMAVRVSQTLAVGLLAITLVTPDLGRSLADAGGAVVDLDPAPRLDQLLPAGSEIMDRAAEAFVHWLFPPGAPSRIPLVSVTGTNGKTTTSRMVARIMRTAGLVPGMASTSGVYVNEVIQLEGDLAGSGGHHILFESRAINMGVLETARGAVAHSGFMFDWCDVAVCLNVTADHLGEFGVDTLGEMTALKRSVLERAHRAVVLNADYRTCVEMLPFAPGVQIYLASVESGVGSVLDLVDVPAHACVLEQENGVDFIVLYEPDGKRLPLMPVCAIPATIDGAARFNTSNAQHAICACHALGVDLDLIRRGLLSFDASFENNPGRLNIYRGLPFTVIMDYAHNPDGMAKLGEFIRHLDVPGRRILLYAVTGNRTDLEVDASSRAAIGLFDHFVCRSYPHLRGRGPGEIPTLMKASLLEAGVAEERITLALDPEDGPRQAMSLAQPGDLVVLTVGSGEFERLWQKILSFQPATVA